MEDFGTRVTQMIMINPYDFRYYLISLIIGNQRHQRSICILTRI
jgi:hypothetical protein